MKLGYGELDDGRGLHAEREQFLKALDTIDENIKEKLFTKCYPLFKHVDVPVPDYVIASKVPGGRSDIDMLIERIQEWQKEFNLMDDWFRDVALCTLQDGSDWRQPSYRPRSFRYRGSADLKLDYDFNLAWHTESEIIDRLLLTLRPQVSEIVQGALNNELEKGVKRTRSKRNRSGTVTLHYEWLARYVVRKEPFRRIQIRTNESGIDVSEDAIEKAVKDTAHRIGLTIPPETKN